MDVEKREHSYNDGDISWYSHCEKLWIFLRKLKIELPYYLAIPLLGIYPDKAVIQKDTCTPIHSSTLHNSQDMETTKKSKDK